MQIIYVLMRAGQSCELGLPFPSTKEALKQAFVHRVQAANGYFDIQSIQIMLVYSVNEKAGDNQIIGLFNFEAVCSVEYAHAMNISHDELTWPLGLQQEVQEDHQAKMSGTAGRWRPSKTAADSGNDVREVGQDE